MVKKRKTKTDWSTIGLIIGLIVGAYLILNKLGVM